MTEQLVGLIPAAGKGLRLYPYTDTMPKTLLNVDGVPIMQRNIILMRDALGIRKIHVIVGHMKEEIIRRFGDGKPLGVDLNYIETHAIEKGLADGILLAEKYIKGDFCVILGDEVYHDSNHGELAKFIGKDYSAVCAIKEVKHPHVIKKNYSVELRDGAIVALVEKPEVIRNNLLGCGTYLFRQEIFDYIRKTPVSPRSKRIELIDTIDLLARENNRVFPFMLKGEYMNINNIDDYNSANYMLRSVNFSKKTISLIIPAYNEESSIGYVVDDFKGRVNEILVVNNNSQDMTEKIAREKGARVLTGSFKGYGDALRAGMENATGDIFILTEADGSFFARDLGKIMEYLKDADMVLGTRTTKQMIEQAANMNFLLRWGNVVVAKLIEFLWLYKNEPRLTDVGCTYRGIWNPVYREMRDSLIGCGPEFAPEMIIEAMHHNKRIIEIPITYSGRLGGESKFSKSIFANARTAGKMLKLIIYKKGLDILERYFHVRYPAHKHGE